MNILERLFGSSARVKLMRLFLMNPEDVYDVRMMASRSKVDPSIIRKEVRMYEEIGLIRPRSAIQMVPKKGSKDGGVMEKRKLSGWGMNPQFPHLSALRALVTEIAIGKEDIAARFRQAGTVKLIVVAGVFLDESDSRVDILIVGDKLKKSIVENALRRLEAELGKELTYGILDTQEFEYRYGIYDKFVRDILDFPHQVVVDRIGVSKK
jgi:hypothetical protein